MVTHLPQEDTAKEGPGQVSALGSLLPDLRVKQYLPPLRRSRSAASILEKHPFLGWIQGCGYWCCHGSTLNMLIDVRNAAHFWHFPISLHRAGYLRVPNMYRMLSSIPKHFFNPVLPPEPYYCFLIIQGLGISCSSR